MGTLYVVTNGETYGEKKGLVQGAVNSYLTEKGICYANCLSKLLNDFRIDIILYSPYDRTRITAEIIAQEKRLKIKSDTSFREKYFGQYENRKLDTINFASLFKYGVDIGLSEEMDDFVLRVKNEIVRIKRVYKDQNVVLVTHPGPAAIISCYFDDKNIPDGEGFVEILNKVKSVLVTQYTL